MGIVGYGPLTVVCFVLFHSALHCASGSARRSFYLFERLSFLAHALNSLVVIRLTSAASETVFSPRLRIVYIFV